MDFLQQLNPQTIAVIGVLLILREVFGFLKLKQTRDTLTDNNQQSMKTMTDCLEKVSEHISAQTELIKGFAFEINEVRKDLDKLNAEVARQGRA